MKNIPYDSYSTVFDCLIDAGYSEEESEQLIADIIEDQIEFTNFAERLHLILKETVKNNYH